MHDRPMSEKLLFANLFAVAIALGGCHIAHIAGRKYYLRTKERKSLVPAIVSTTEAVILILLALIIVQIK